MNKKKIIFVTIYIILIFLLAAYKHYTFQSTYELGIENRKLIQTMKGHFYYFDDFDWNDLGNHFHIVNILIVFPIHYLFSSVYTLIIIKILALVTSALVVYEISKDLGDVADLLFYGFLMFPMIIHIQLEDYHAVIFSVPFFLLTFLAFQKNWTKRFYLFLICLLLVQEDISLMVIMLGGYLFFHDKARGIKVLLIGIIAFLLIPNMIQPAIMNSEWFFHYSYKYGYLGSTLPKIVKTIVTNPIHSFTYTPLYQKAILIKSLLTPYAFLPLLSPISIIAIPPILEIALHDGVEHMCSNSYHALPIYVVFFVATIDVLRRMTVKWRKKIAKTLFVLIIIFLLIGEVGHWLSDDYLFNYNFFGGESCKKNEFQFFTEDRNFIASQNYKKIHELIDEIPENSSVLVPFHLYSHFTNFKTTKTFYAIDDCFNYDYIIFDKQDVYLPNLERFDVILEDLKKGYEVILQIDRLYILEKNEGICI